MRTAGPSMWTALPHVADIYRRGDPSAWVGGGPRGMGEIPSAFRLSEVASSPVYVAPPVSSERHKTESVRNLAQRERERERELCCQSNLLALFVEPFPAGEMDRSAGNNSSPSASGSDSSLVRLKRQCELCSLPACLHCASDEAHLCWACDARIHAANFLVARHPRAFLCSSCGHPTQLSSTGPRLQPRLYLCQRCCCTAEEDGIWNLDEESKVDCTEIADEISTGERDSVRKASGVMGGNSRVASSKIRGTFAANCWIEGVGDSEEEDYRHYIGCDGGGGESRSSQEATRYKRRKLVGLSHPLRTV